MLTRYPSRPNGAGLMNARAMPIALPERSRSIPGFPVRKPRPESATRLNVRLSGLWRWYWLGLVGYLLLVYLLVNLAVPRLLPGALNIYVVQPLLWGSLAGAAYVGWRFGLKARPKHSRLLLALALLTGLFQIAMTIIAGLIYGFGRSPYSHTFTAILGNLLYLASLLLAIELTRSYLVAVFSQGNHILAVLSPSLLLAIVGIPLAKFGTAAEPQSFFRFQGEIILPAISESFLASFLAYLGGPLAAIAYRGAIQAFEWLSPALPDLQWTITAFLGTLVPAFGLIVIRNQVMPAVIRPMDEASRSQVSTSWVLVAATAAALIWFNAGLFGFQPTLVSGVSMNPTLVVGDIVITRQVGPDEIEPGDIIRFRAGNSYIIHRVVEVERGARGTYFVTQGDANNVQDSPFPADALEGKVVATIPKIGWVSIGVRNLLQLIP